MDITEGQIAQLVVLIGATSAAVVAIIRALKENTAAVQAGNTRAAGADEEKLALARQAAQADAQKIALSQRIADPFTESPTAPVPAQTAADPLEARIRRIEERLAEVTQGG